MAYCRMSPESDVYLYPSINGICCCSCSIHEEKHHNTVLDSLEEAWDHLLHHVAAGDNVPEWAFERLRREMDQLDEEWQAALDQLFTWEGF